MTQQELEAIWVRYMHRNDIAQDFATTYLLATEAIKTRLMYVYDDTTVPFDEYILAEAPQLYVHAGLLQLAEMAQDDTQLERETMKFGQAAKDWQLYRSIKEDPAPQMRAS